MNRFMGFVVLIIGGILLPVVFQLPDDIETVSVPGEAFVTLIPLFYILALIIVTAILFKRPA